MHIMLNNNSINHTTDVHTNTTTAYLNKAVIVDQLMTNYLGLKPGNHSYKRSDSSQLLGNLFSITTITSFSAELS